MKKTGLFRFIRVVVVIIVSVAVAAVLIAVRPRAQRRPLQQVGQLVETFAPARTTVAMPVDAFGTVRPSEQVRLVSQVRGTVVALAPSFVDGGPIAAGAELLTIDPRDYQLEVDRLSVQIRQARAELDIIQQRAFNLEALLAISRANVSLAQTDYQRLEELADLKVSSQTQRDQAHQRYLTARERHQSLQNELALIPMARNQAEAALEKAEVLHSQALLNLDRTRILAPFDGRVVEKNVEVGDQVTAGGYLGTVYRQGALEVDVRIPMEDVHWLKDDAGVIPSLAAEVHISGHPDAGRWAARILRTQAAVDAKTRTLPLILAIDGRPPEAAGGASTRRLDLLPGMFVSVRILGRQVPGVMALPRYAVHEGDRVYLADGDRLSIRPVAVMRQYGDTVYVAGGIGPSDRVIRTPLVGAVDGMPIRTKDETEPAAGTPAP